MILIVLARLNIKPNAAKKYQIINRLSDHKRPTQRIRSRYVTHITFSQYYLHVQEYINELIISYQKSPQGFGTDDDVTNSLVLNNYINN